jgi:hypothetical protein
MASKTAPSAAKSNGASKSKVKSSGAQGNDDANGVGVGASKSDVLAGWLYKLSTARVKTWK